MQATRAAGLIGTRLLSVIPTVLIVVVLVFLMIHLSPGDPAVRAAGGIEATPEGIAAARERMGLNDPLYVQFFRWFGGILQGDLGTSLFNSQPVADALLERMPVTLSLTLFGVGFALLLAVPAGISAGYWPGGMLDRLVMWMSAFAVSAPSFFVALVLIAFFSHTLQILPATSYVPLTQDPGKWALHLVMPGLAVSLSVAAELARHIRSSLRDVLMQEYIRTAIAKGVPTRTILLKHAMKNAAIPVVTVLGIQLQKVLSGVAVVEIVFGINGLGALAVQSVFDQDYTMIQGVVMFSIVLVVAINFLVDLCYVLLNPRVGR